MNTTLHKFTTDHLFDASAAMLSHLKIKFTPQTKEPMSFPELYRDATSSPMPKSLAEVYGKIKECYFVGAIDEESLAGRDSSFAIGSNTEAIAEGKYVSMLVFAVDVKVGQRLTRTELATLTRGFNRIADAMPVVLFVRNGHHLSLATIERSAYTQAWRDGEKLGKVSILRDIDTEQPHRGHIDILNSLGDKAYPTFDELYKHWFEVFSSELLTKKFYTELSEWYAWAVQNVRFPNDLSTTEDDMKYNQEGVIRLITRLIFVWFLKQKHLIPEEFFDEKYIREYFISNFDPHSADSLFYDPQQSKYYRLILQNLFFAMLNRPIVAEDSTEPDNRRFREAGFKGYNVNNLMRYESEFAPGGASRFLEFANSTIPYLHGGLFECLDKKGKSNGDMYYDGFSERTASLQQLSLPDYFFFGEEVGSDVDLSRWYDDKSKKHTKVRGLINILKSYNFTVEENTPLDQEVSLDPELLGKVFENLLASYNPETGTTARKQTGSFYTPREIVQYMVDESLVAYLSRVCGSENESRYRELFSYSSDNVEFSDKERKEIIAALHDCKVLDPACGSGAFPVGVLQQMVHALRKLDPTNQQWKEFILEVALRRDKEAYLETDEEERRNRRADIEQSFNESVNDPDYARKLYLIENCIFGVDIQPIAIQISKLRFFISLVADQKPKYDDPLSNFGIRPLPNLEAKFVAANTLIQLGEGTIFTETEDIIEIKRRLADANHRLFRARRNFKKNTIKEQIKVIRNEYRQALEATCALDSDSASLLANWDMFEQNDYARFFNPQWMFGVGDGFDIVIGNPPYIQLQKAIGVKGIDKKGKEYDVKLGDLYVNEKFESFAKTGDIYCLFYELGWRILKPQGHLCYITSNKWMRAGYGESLRNFFIKHTDPKLLVDFSGIQIFDNATVDTNILLLGKGENAHKTLAVSGNKEDKSILNNLSDFVQQKGTVSSFDSSNSWVVLSPIEQSIKRKIEAVGTPLRDWDIQINYGIKTGYNDAFVISTENRNQILSNCRDENERAMTEALIRPILRGRDIKRYGYDWADLWLINTHNGIKGKLERIHIEDYPAVKAHLDQYWPQISICNLQELFQIFSVNKVSAVRFSF